MRKGFTMIELIFVIVILGVLASVAIPRLAATRDDAEVAKAATNLTTAVSDITAYYTAKGTFKGSGTSNVTFDKITNALNKSGQLLVKGSTECVKVALPAADATTGAGTTASTKVELKLRFTDADAVCKQLRTLPGIKAMCGKSGSDESITANSSSACKIQIGGSGGIQF